MYESVQDAEKRKRVVVMKKKKVEEQSRGVACFCCERKENTAVVWEVATVGGCLHDDVATCSCKRSTNSLNRRDM